MIRESGCYIRGLQRGLRIAGYSLARRLAVHLFFASLLYGTGLAFCWYAADLYLGFRTDPIAIGKLVINKRDAWCSQHLDAWACAPKKGKRHE